MVTKNNTLGLTTITLSGEELKKAIANDFADVKEVSPYANFSETDVENGLDIATLIDLIEGSSYFHKKMTKSAKAIERMPRAQLVETYRECRQYATENIIQSLYPVNELPKPVNHLDCATEKFYILGRVRTNYEQPTAAETIKERAYLSFTLSSEQNLSHFPGLVWYGIRSDITPQMIGLISSMDADTRSWARNRMELGPYREELLDAEDLVKASLSFKTYSQLSIKSHTVTYTGPIIHRTPLKYDCVLCINRANDYAKRASDEHEIPILILHPNERTLCRIHDFYHTPELAQPKYF